MIEKIRQYLKARIELIELSKKEPLISGNDNIIGSRIGEFLAIELYKLKNINTIKEVSSTNPGFDLTYINGNEKRKISVKLITGENEYGRTTRLKKDWDDFILIELNSKYRIIKIGLLAFEKFKIAKEMFCYSETPIVKRTMLNKNGMILKSGGELVSSQDIEKLNNLIWN